MCGRSVYLLCELLVGKFIFGKEKRSRTIYYLLQPRRKPFFSVGCRRWDTIIYIRVPHLREKSIIKVSLLHDLFLTESSVMHEKQEVKSLPSQNSAISLWFLLFLSWVEWSERMERQIVVVLAFSSDNKIKRSIIHVTNVDISIKNAIAGKFFTFLLFLIDSSPAGVSAPFTVTFEVRQKCSNSY